MGRPRKYFTEEERKAAKNARQKRYNQKNKEKIVEYYQKNKEKFAKRHADYYQNNKEKIAAYKAEWYQQHKDEVNVKQAEYSAKYYQNNKEKIAAKQAEYYGTPFGRARNLVGNYHKADKKYNRGECTITAEWIVENIFSQPCHYCGESDWHKLGCDRKDSSLPHTPENCVPCCKACNDKKHTTPYDDYIKIIKSGGSPTS